MGLKTQTDFMVLYGHAQNSSRVTNGLNGNTGYSFRIAGSSGPSGCVCHNKKSSKQKSRSVHRVWGSKSLPRRRRGTVPGGKDSYKPPGAPQTSEGKPKPTFDLKPDTLSKK